jgi:hypothetical protein
MCLIAVVCRQSNEALKKLTMDSNGIGAEGIDALDQEFLQDVRRCLFGLHAHAQLNEMLLVAHSSDG